MQGLAGTDCLEAHAMARGSRSKYRGSRSKYAVTASDADGAQVASMS
jgi:hypothetical protein